jgi:hypothetical protein
MAIERQRTANGKCSRPAREARQSGLFNFLNAELREADSQLESFATLLLRFRL